MPNTWYLSGRVPVSCIPAQALQLPFTFPDDTIIHIPAMGCNRPYGINRAAKSVRRNMGGCNRVSRRMCCKYCIRPFHGYRCGMGIKRCLSNICHPEYAGSRPLSAGIYRRMWPDIPGPLLLKIPKNTFCTISCPESKNPFVRLEKTVINPFSVWPAEHKRDIPPDVGQQCRWFDGF